MPLAATSTFLSRTVTTPTTSSPTTRLASALLSPAPAPSLTSVFRGVPPTSPVTVAQPAPPAPPQLPTSLPMRLYSAPPPTNIGLLGRITPAAPPVQVGSTLTTPSVPQNTFATSTGLSGMLSRLSQFGAAVRGPAAMEPPRNLPLPYVDPASFSALPVRTSVPDPFVPGGSSNFAGNMPGPMPPANSAAQLGPGPGYPGEAGPQGWPDGTTPTPPAAAPVPWTKYLLWGGLALGGAWLIFGRRSSPA